MSDHQVPFEELMIPITKAVTAKFTNPNGSRNFQQKFIILSNRTRVMLARIHKITKMTTATLTKK
jgi:hypothetical protein